MTTAQDLINSSAKQAGVLAEGQTLPGGINADSLTRFNRMLGRWRNDGVDLGITLPLLASDDVIVDFSDEEAIETNFTLRLMVRFRRPIPPGLSAAGKDAFTELQAKYMTIRPMQLDPALTRKYLPRKRPLESIN